MSYEECLICAKDITNDVQFYLCKTCAARRPQQGSTSLLVTREAVERLLTEGDGAILIRVDGERIFLQPVRSLVLERNAQRVQTTEGRSPSSDLEILGHNSTDGGRGVQNASSAEHLSTALPNTEKNAPTSETRGEPYAPQRHARIVWQNVCGFFGFRFMRSLEDPFLLIAGENRRVAEVHVKEEIAAMLTRAHAIGFAAGELAMREARTATREGRLRLALREAAGAVEDVLALRTRLRRAQDAAYAALGEDPCDAANRPGSGGQ